MIEAGKGKGMSEHLATWPPKCAECGKFMPTDRSKIERRDYGLPMAGADDFETGVCINCEQESEQYAAWVEEERHLHEMRELENREMEEHFRKHPHG